MTCHPTNRQRVRRIARLLSWCPRSWCDPGDLPESLIDLLADARHWCDANSLSFADLDRQAYQHYLAETEAERSNS